ncbi:MAG: D-cysteine desulfhydrase family protein [Spirochaetes bacterium]|nr:D-cysteine desulfhydrase family protein [Spirochaetota bacterium]MBU1079855.1 D-cysteine desulfhydrase family protein [Spirochaetota bacterium]
MKAVPRLRFAHLPTPIEPLPRLSAFLGGPRLFMKRDDQTGLALGGNKTRKLEFLVADALAKGAKTLVSAGALQSNHCRQTAAAAARFGLDCVLVLNGDGSGAPTGNYLLDVLFGARVVTVADRKDRDRVFKETFDEVAASGGLPYLVPYGGSSPVGALGYAFAVQEFMGQGLEADYMVFGTSSGGTHAGIALGQRLFGYGGTALGISIDEPASALKAHVSALASEASELLGPRIDFSPDDILADDSYCEAGYGVLTGLEREAVRLFAKYEGALLDPVYTGRAAGGLVSLIRDGRFKPDETVVFWNTGGQPALFAEAYQTSMLG